VERWRPFTLKTAFELSWRSASLIVEQAATLNQWEDPGADSPVLDNRHPNKSSADRLHIHGGADWMVRCCWRFAARRWDGQSRRSSNVSLKGGGQSTTCTVSGSYGLVHIAEIIMASTFISGLGDGNHGLNTIRPQCRILKEVILGIRIAPTYHDSLPARFTVRGQVGPGNFSTGSFADSCSHSPSRAVVPWPRVRLRADAGPHRTVHIRRSGILRNRRIMM
jgi:hypothetical protein